VIIREHNRAARSKARRCVTAAKRRGFCQRPSLCHRKWFDELEQLDASWEERKRPLIEYLRAESLLESGDLSAYGWLLNSISHVAHSRSDAAMLRNVIEELEVMNVHHRIIRF